MQIPGFTVTEEVYHGRTRVVYRGRRDRDGVPVILKTFTDEVPAAVADASLRREYDLVKDLDVPGVARAYGLTPAGDRVVLVLEDVGGERLKTLIAAGPIDVRTALRMGIELSETITALHQRGILHKDVNPNNVLVDRQAGRTTLIDFSIASRLPFEQQLPSHPNVLQGTIAYMSPEQTGRMNRDVDYRTDFYSLGVTLYEMLTGKLPFESLDPLEVVHCHIAKAPVAPSALDAALPRPLSDIVMKLLAKTAEDRYQSGFGLRADLARCLEEWDATGRIEGVVAGATDLADRFLIPQRLYGRHDEVATLQAAFERASIGAAELLLVSGYSGIGKTSLIHELHKSLAHRRGYFIAGKFDQLARDTPHGGLAQAFQGLIRQLLTESEEAVRGWRDALLEALGVNAQVIIDVIPAVERIVGKQPPVPLLGATESQNRFNLLFQKFLGVFATPAHPLVIFLDDLQWADSATLALLRTLLANLDFRGLLVLGAYRDNEVSDRHPLMLTLSEIRAAGTPLREITLGPLPPAHLTQFVADTLHTDGERAGPLANLVLSKTAGNPFFVTQFLKTLHQEELVAFDYSANHWHFDLARIRRMGITDNVVDLMAAKIRKLPAPTQEVLKLAACIGNRFTLPVLATVSVSSVEAAGLDLWSAVEQGLVVPLDDAAGAGREDAQESGLSVSLSYKFLHDRVQQAAYALIADEGKRHVHLTVGRLMLSHCPAAELERQIFDIVHHLNLGRGLIADDAERVALVRLNLSAGQKAKSSTAYEAALGYLNAGLSLVSDELWDSDYGLAFALRLEAAECQYHCGNFDAAEQQFALLLQRAATRLDKARVYRLRSVQYENMSRYADALASAREGLTLFGVSFPDSPGEKQAALEGEITTIQSLLGQRTIASLVDLPVMTDPEVRMVMNILTDIWSSAYIVGDPVLARLISATMVRLSLVHGNVEESAYGYVTHAITVGPVRGDYQSAYELGRLALRVNERFNDSRRRAKIHQQFHAHVNLWRQPMHTCLPYAREACRSGLETGDFLYAAYGASTETWPAMVSTQDLAQFVRAYSPYLALINKLKATGFADSLKIILNWARALQGRTRAPLSLSDDAIDENEYVETYRGNPFFTTFHAVAKLQLCYLFGEYGRALEAARMARAVVYHLSGTIWPVEFDFWNGLTLAANYPDATEDERRTYLEEMQTAQKSHAVLAENCPENFLCQSLLLSAEIECIAGRPLSALDLYERAIRYAGETSMLQHQALANELCARFWLGRRQANVAAVFLAAARHAYAQWGATAKVADLERRYPALLTRSAADGARLELEPLAPAGTTQSTTRTEVSTIDLVTVIKAAQAIAGEIELERLLAALMCILIQNAGARKGFLILEQGGQPLIQARGAVDAPQVTVLQGAPVAVSRDLAPAIVNYVWRTSESVVLADAASDPTYGGDPYIARNKSKSILCTPVLNQRRLVGVVYLENELTTGAFTPDRIQVLQMLSAQAAIAISNARLFAEVSQLRDRLQAENVYLHEEIKTQQGFEDLVGQSPALTAVLRKVEQVAPTDTTVLILGETGTGKELIARGIHRLSRRRERALVTVNCGAIAPGLVESELFGHERGAFTGAVSRKIGRFELADGGTIFLDEIGDLPLDLQVKLLRVLQEGEIERVGGSRTITVDVRVIAATHNDLGEAVKAGQFRSDLFYRLNVFPMETPPLRDRKEDIPLLVRHFAMQYGIKLGKRIEAIPKRTLDALMAYQWPGNIRELRNVIERALIITQGTTLELRDWAPGDAAAGEAGVRRLEDIERQHILAVLEQKAWRVSGPKGAATLLGLKPTTLEARMRKLGIQRPSAPVPNISGPSQ
jgi:predicted ATPase/transcriptional regulator with GAF, ATPase, and Fis domain/tRNA A-37 threonylcarbamoyl transferase component Bud32